MLAVQKLPKAETTAFGCTQGLAKLRIRKKRVSLVSLERSGLQNTLVVSASGSLVPSFTQQPEASLGGLARVLSRPDHEIDSWKCE